MDKKNVFGCVILICLSILIAGCWDRRELQDRNFILAVGIDMADVHTPIETFTQPHGSKRYRLSLQILKLGAGGDGKEKSKTYVISNTGDSFFEMVRDMLGQTSKSLWFEHVQVIIISEAVLRQTGLGELLDFFKRDSEMRSRMHVYVTSGVAKSLLEYIPPNKEPGGIYLSNIVDLHVKNVHVAGKRTDLASLALYSDNNANLVVSRIEMVDKVVKLGGLAIFKKDKFIGYVDEDAVAGIKYMFGSEKSAIVTIPCPDHSDHQVIFELFRHDTRLRPHVDGDTIYFTLDINMYGNIGELQGDIALDNTMDPQYVNNLESAFADEIKRTVLYSQQIIQKKMRVDILNLFATKLKAYEPDTWAKVKDQWDEIYPDIPLIISVNVSIRNIGSHK